MNVAQLLRDSDPLRFERLPTTTERERMRRAVLRTPPHESAHLYRRRLVVATIMVVLLGVALQFWPAERSGSLHAAVRFEVRLAEEQSGPGLSAVRVDGSRTIYLHSDAVVTNGDIADSVVIPGKGATDFSISVQFTAAGAQKLRDVTTRHIGKPVAILIDGQVVMAPTLKSMISTSAAITGNFTKAEAERIVKGIR